MGKGIQPPISSRGLRFEVPCTSNAEVCYNAASGCPCSTGQRQEIVVFLINAGLRWRLSLFLGAIAHRAVQADCPRHQLHDRGRKSDDLSNQAEHFLTSPVLLGGAARTGNPAGIASIIAQSQAHRAQKIENMFEQNVLIPWMRTASYTGQLAA